MLINVLLEHTRVTSKPHVPIQMMDLIANVTLASLAMALIVLTKMNVHQDKLMLHTGSEIALVWNLAF